MISEREKEILQLVAHGRSNRQIAAQLMISEHTVKVHLRNIFSKIGATSRTEAGMYAIRQGWVSDVPPEAVAPTRPLEIAQPPTVGVVTPRVAGRWRSWPLSQKIAAALVGVALIGVASWWWSLRTPVLQPPTVALTRWREMSALPEPQRGGQLVVSRGELWALCGDLPRWWWYEATTLQWQRRADVPFSCAGAVVVAHRTWVWVFVNDTREIWRWDGTYWRQQPNMPVPGQLMRVTAWGDTLLLAVTHQGSQQLWQWDGVEPSWRLLLTQEMPHPWYPVVLDDIVYLFGDSDRVWQYMEPTHGLQAMASLPFVWGQSTATSVLGTMLLVDLQTDLLWGYVPQRGGDRQQALPAMIASAQWQMVPWQAELLFANDDLSQMYGYQAVFQSFVPVLSEP
jgi:DNA-binding CsgD family transcriptional regulator